MIEKFVYKNLGLPDRAIGGWGDPYLLRWHIRRTPGDANKGNIYLHQFLRDDDDRALHDHPWPSLSVCIGGGYHEVLVGNVIKWRPVGSIVWRRSTHQHRIVLDRGRPAWTIFVTGPKVRSWGFWCPQGFVYWRDFMDPNDPDTIGAGCGDE